MEWISVEERLPKNQQRVIYYFELTGAHVGAYYDSVDGPLFVGDKGYLTDDVTHWMPLPEPPKRK